MVAPLGIWAAFLNSVLVWLMSYGLWWTPLGQADFKSRNIIPVLMIVITFKK